MPELLNRIVSTTWGRVAIGGVLALVITAVAVLSGGGNDAEVEPPQPTATEAPAPTATVEPTPEPTATPAPTPTPEAVSPLNGTPVDEETLTRRVLGVKIDNAPEARPQAGIEQADMMIEIWVEGITRFLALWQQADTEFVGPIRSMRPTDFHIQNFLESTFVNSGGQGFVQAIGNASNVRYFQEPSGTFRVSGRFAPHNLFGDTNQLRPLDDRGDYDEPLAPLWPFGEMPSDAAPATEVVTSWPGGYVVSWSWNGETYERTTTGVAHEYVTADGVTGRVNADTLVMLEMPIVTAGGGAGTPVPESVTTGTGPAWVFSGGTMIQGTWARETDTEWFTLTGANGNDITVPPGRLWLVLPQTGGVAAS